MKYTVLGLSAILLINYQLCLSQFDISTVFDIAIGNGENEIAMYNDQLDMDYEIVPSGNLYLLDAVHDRIKVFTPQGKYKMSISAPEERLIRFYIYKDWLVLLTGNSDPFSAGRSHLFILNLAGEVLLKHHLKIKNPNLPNSFFYKDMVFIPQVGRDFFSSNLFLYRLNIEYHDLDNPLIEIKEGEQLNRSYDPDREYQFIPVEREYRTYFRKLHPTSFMHQTEDFVLLQIYEKSYEEPPVYYLFLKSDRSFKKIGELPSGKTGALYINGHGKIYSRNLYVLGVKLVGEVPRERESIIISKIDLSSVDELPSVDPFM